MTRIALDLSHHQNPRTLPWDKFGKSVAAIIVRASYGAELRDREVVEHVRRARGINVFVGLYTFYRPHHPVQKQFDLFRSVADRVELGHGDIVPCLDIEHDPLPKPGTPVSSAWAAPVQEYAQLLDEWFGAKCMPYITQREWGMLGKPSWILQEDRPIWVAHYKTGDSPATPANRPWTLWQNYVGPFNPNPPGGYDKARPELDHNRINGDLPLIGSAPTGTLPPPPEQGGDEEWDELRDRAVALQFPDWDLLGPNHTPADFREPEDT
jgi:hypothetical protein